MQEQEKEIMNLLKTSRGQIDGIIRMIEDERYCVDVSKQILAVQALLKKANMRILDRHIKSCVKQVDEIIEILERYAK